MAEAPAPTPSDAATAAEGRLYDVELHDVDDPTFHLRWGGRHAAATLAALRHAHRDRTQVRQVDWGSYEAVLDGAAARLLLASVLDDEAWRSEPVEVVPHGDHRDEPPPPLELGRAVDLLGDGRRYSVLADVY
jgi:hypothetical protein